ncbi:hypothetical protein R5R35_014768 [Gryllus longicercus]|uniref:beta-glucosidase n=1 Tax=Gryllus longicercus TaxID=2509291 RepID=A0AAN9VSC2_9ORTH
MNSPTANAALTFPPTFKFGVATAAYQVEGAWDEDGKGENIWDHLLHKNPEFTEDRANGDIANDSYHRYKEDVQLVKALNVDFYRFSIAWSRILPKGDLSVVNQKGLDYYNNLIDEVVANGIEPMVTIYHWDLPQELQKLGGWTNRETALYFRDYAELLFTSFGDRVKWWITFNDPQVISSGYSGDKMAPNVEKPGVGDYLCGHTVLLAHSQAFHLYDSTFRATQKGQVGIVFGGSWAIPKTDSPDDIAAAERYMQFYLGWFAHPIFSQEGDYPHVMRERVAANSAREGLRRSRLPQFSREEIELLRGSSDFLGLNHYTSFHVEADETGPCPSLGRDSGAVLSQDPSWPGSGSSWLKVVPWGFRNVLSWIHEQYNGPNIIITENGFSDRDGRIDDMERISYYKSYIQELLKAIHKDGVKVTGYSAWSLMDNLEWASGYREKFGLYQVDYNNPNRTRTPKKSSKFFAEIARTHKLPS